MDAPDSHRFAHSSRQNFRLITKQIAAMLGVSGLAKVGQATAFAATLRRYGILPSWSVELVSVVIPWLEVIVAVLLITGIVPVLTALLTLFEALASS